MASLLFIVVAYLIGSLSFAVIISRLMGLSDPRTYGSGNPGATNVLRSGNKAAAALTLFCDGAKGWLAVWLVQRFGEQYGVGEGMIALVAIAVFLGHLWPIFFRFKGGKGVATALGVLLALNGWLALATLVTWLVIVFASRYSSLAALVAALFAPFYYGLLFGFDSNLLAVLVMSGLLIYRHSKNIGNLIRGKESRIGGKRIGDKRKKTR